MKTIMIVDDESNILEEISSYLKEDDFKVITTTNSREALEHMREMKEDVSLILVGTSLPDGDESALFSMKPKSRMNVDTSNVEDFLQKPFTKEQLLDFVKRRV